MRAWRLCRAPYARDPLSGRGGLAAGGRWHIKGLPVVYTSATLSLAALEVLVHTDVDTAPEDLVAIEIDIPDDLPRTVVRVADLPRGWRKAPAPRALQEMGARWLSGGKTAVLEVPSALTPVEKNYLINPRHGDARRIRVVRKEKFQFDPRLLS